MLINSIKRAAVVILTLCMLLPAVSCGAGEKISYSDGDISNAGFEESSDEHWSLSGAAAIVTDLACAELSSLRLGSEDTYQAGAVQHISGLQPGYYYLEAYALSEGNQEYCYIYANGTGQGQCMTAVPRSTEEGRWVKVTVRGIEVQEDGLMELGVCSKGEDQLVYFDSFSLGYEKDQATQYESLFGGAVSWLDWVEDMGGRYYRADGTEADALQIMAENGCNFVRLELYNNPGDYVNEWGEAFPAGYKNADSIFELAKRAHEKGMKIQLSFMYSDYWGNTAIPSDWMEKIEGIEDEERIADILTDCLYEFTSGFMTRLADAGIYPEYVSLGNEMQGGILEPYGRTYTTDEAMEAFCSFMDAGYRAVKEVSPDSQIVLHIACNADDMFWRSKSGSGKWFFGLCEEYGIKYDIIGTSFYPYWAQTDDPNAVKNALDTGDLVEWCNMMIDTFDKDILIMESGINWGRPGQLANNGAYKGIYTCTREGQRDYMFELINAIKSVKDGRCIGDLYWDPILVQQPGIGYAVNASDGSAKANVVETTTFFDYDHIALPVFDAYRYNVTGDDTAAVYGVICGADGAPIADRTFTLTFDGSEYSITTDGYGEYFIRIHAGEGTVNIENGDNVQLSANPGSFNCVDLTLG